MSLGTVNLNWRESNGKLTEDDVHNFLSKEPTPPPDPKPIYLEESSAILRDIAGYYRFDGYLFNYEEMYNFAAGDQAGMKEIMSDLKQAGLTMVWYDAPLSSPTPFPASQLTKEAYPFFEAAGYFHLITSGGRGSNGTVRITRHFLERFASGQNRPSGRPSRTRCGDRDLRHAKYFDRSQPPCNRKRSRRKTSIRASHRCGGSTYR